MGWEVNEERLQAAMDGLPLLTIDLVKDRAKEGLVLVTCANWQYYDFVLNWVGHLRKIGITNFLIGRDLKDPLESAGWSPISSFLLIS